MATTDLQSEQRIRLLDIIGEGQIAGLKNGWQSVYLDGTPLQNPDGTFNADGVKAYFRDGTARQDPVPDWDGVETETGVNLELKYNRPLTRTINNLNTTSVRVTLSVGALYNQNQTTGEFSGDAVDIQVLLQNNGGGFQVVANTGFNGKTMTKFQRELKVQLPAPGPWDIRVNRVTADSTSPYKVNTTYWDAYTEIIESRFYQPYSAYAALDLPAVAFSAIPRRVYNVLGRRVMIPTNYDPASATYAGVWDGSWKEAYCNNPVWCWLDLLISVRYGLGAYVGLQQVDKWALYEIAQYCDGLVPDGKGGMERRFTLNTVIDSQSEAFDLLNNLASTFRGIIYAEEGQLRAVADMPRDPVAFFGNASVQDGKFAYSGADIRARHTCAMIGWNDPDGLGQPRVAYIEDRDGIQKLGLIQLDLTAVGCTSETQAIRVGKWALYTERMETEIVTFALNMEGQYIYPGAVFEIADARRAGERRAGRIAGVQSQTTLELDGPVNFDPLISYTLQVMMADGTIEKKELLQLDGVHQVVTASSPFTGTPRVGAVWLIRSVDLQPTTWRCTGITENEGGLMGVTGLAYTPGRFLEIEYGIKVPADDTTNISFRPPPVTNLQVTEELYQISAANIGERALLSWVSQQPRFVVRWRPGNGNWTETTTTAPNIAIPIPPGYYEFEVVAVNALGVRSLPAYIAYTLIGRMALPADVLRFGLQPVNDVGMFTWNRSPDLDVLVGGRFEIRYSPDLTGVTWSTAVPVMLAVPGMAVSVEMPLRAGTYLIKAVDSLGNYSKNAAVIVTTYQSASAIHSVWSSCDNPEFAGHRVNTIWRDDIDSLIIGGTGNEWDAMDETIVPGGMDKWTDVDVLQVAPDGYMSGRYYAEHRLDMGSVMTSRLTAYMRAFPYKEGEGFFDDRLTDWDSWPDFDQVSDDANGQARVYIRQTDDDPDGWTDVDGNFHEPVWTDWAPFTIGDYRGRAFEFVVEMSAEIGSNVALNELCFYADMPEKQASGADVDYPGHKIHLDWPLIEFWEMPSVGITLQNGHTGDRIELTNKTLTGVDLEVFDSSGAQAVGRSFDWLAVGI